MSAAANTAVIATFADPEPWIIDDGTPGGKPLSGVYDGPTERLVMGVGIESYAPRLTVQSTDVTDLASHGTALTRGLDGKDYTITGAEPDGQGLTVLILTEG